MKKYSKQIIKSVSVFILFFISSYFQLIPLILFDINTKKISGTGKVAISMFSDILLLLILIYMYRKELKKELIKFKDNILENMDIGFKYWFIGLIIMFLSNIFINVILKNGQAGNEQAIQKMISSAPLLMVINAGIIAPIIEEISFRKAFKNLFKNKWVFILTSGIVFGSLHVITKISSPLDFLYIIPYSSLGIAFAYMYYKTDTIYTSMTMHIIHNTLLTVLSIMR